MHALINTSGKRAVAVVAFGALFALFFRYALRRGEVNMRVA